jgi:hypothetical protein
VSRTPFAVGAGLVALVLAGCQAFYPNPGRFQAWTAAGLAGQYHRDFHRWPASQADLAAHDCPRIDEGIADFPAARIESDDVARELPPIRADVCAFLVEFRYRIALRNVGRDLEMTFRGANGDEICKLRVAAPTDDAASALAPGVRITTTIFRCPGEGEWR